GTEAAFSNCLMNEDAQLGCLAVRGATIKGRKAEPADDTILVLGDPQRPEAGRVFLEPRDAALDRNGIRIGGDLAGRYRRIVDLDDLLQVLALGRPVDEGHLLLFPSTRVALTRAAQPHGDRHGVPP